MAIAMDNERDLKSEFDAQVTAALMVQFNALVPVKVAVKLCGISRKEIDRRVHSGTFPQPEKLSSEDKSIRKAFRVQELQSWINNPREYRC